MDHPAPCPETLGTLYRDMSCLTTAQGDQVRGGAHIGDYLARRAAMGAGSLSRERLSFDVLPGGVEGGVLILATGRLSGAGGGGGGGGGDENGRGGGGGEGGTAGGSRGSEAGGEMSSDDGGTGGGGAGGAGALPSFEFSETFLAWVESICSRTTHT